MDMLKLQEQFIGELLNAVTEPWDRITVHYERYQWSGDSSEMYMAHRHLGPEQSDIDLPLEALDALIALQEHPPQGQSEPWTWVEFTIDQTGQYHFDYRYGVPPLTAREIAAQG